MGFFDQLILENSIEAWLIAVGIAMGAFLVLLVIKRIIQSRLKILIKKTTLSADDYLIPIIDRTRWFSLLAVGLLVGVQFLELGGEIDLWFDRVVTIVLTIQGGLWGSGLINYYINRRVLEEIDRDHGEDATTLDALGLIGKIVLWVVLGLVILDNLEVEVNSLITSLGIGGIAVALAVQNILGDLFSSLSITLDKPFAIGDFIVVGEFEGTVDDIGLKSTRVRSLSGEEVVFSNSDLLNSRIRNYKRMEERRISFDIGVVYGTPTEKLDQIPTLIEEIISPLENVRFDRAHFKTLGAYALEFVVVYYVQKPEYAAYLDVQQVINLALYQQFEAEGIQFAYPTTTVLMEGE